MEARLAMRRRRAWLRPHDRALAVLIGLTLLILGAANGPGLAAAQTPGLPACNPADLSAIQTAEPVSGVPAGQVPDIFPGRVTYTNTSSTACTLQGRPLIQALSGAGDVLPVQNNPLPPEQTSFFIVVLQPGQTAFTVFSWFNYCGPTPTPPLSFAVTLPTGGTPITIPLATTTGAPLDAPPRCDTPSQSSSIGVGPFDPGPGALTTPQAPLAGATATTAAVAPPAITPVAAPTAAAPVNATAPPAAPMTLPQTGGPPVPLGALAVFGAVLLGFGSALRRRLG